MMQTLNNPQDMQWLRAMLRMLYTPENENTARPALSFLLAEACQTTGENHRGMLREVTGTRFVASDGRRLAVYETAAVIPPGLYSFKGTRKTAVDLEEFAPISKVETEAPEYPNWRQVAGDAMAEPGSGAFAVRCFDGVDLWRNCTLLGLRMDPDFLLLLPDRRLYTMYVAEADEPAFIVTGDFRLTVMGMRMSRAAAHYEGVEDATLLEIRRRVQARLVPADFNGGCDEKQIHKTTGAKASAPAPGA